MKFERGLAVASVLAMLVLGCVVKEVYFYYFPGGSNEAPQAESQR